MNNNKELMARLLASKVMEYSGITPECKHYELIHDLLIESYESSPEKPIIELIKNKL